ncbi:MAG: FkbM family methyltransferase [Acidobacteria bacterium]|nr:FkbM family methyltransferase [Acidobacteriota bacterium]
MNRQRVIRLGIAGGLTLVGMLFHQHVFAGALVLLGRSPHCRYGLALESISLMQRQQEGAAQVRAGSRRLAGDRIFEQWETPLGVFWLPAASAHEVFFDLAEQMRGIYSVNGRGLRPGDVVLDCGANIGVYTRTALLAGASKVVAVEPAPENLECLRRNYAKEIAEGRVIVYPKGVWDKDDWLTLYVHPTNSAGDSFVRQMPGAKPAAQKFPLTPMDKLVEELKLDRVDYIKFDIEGAERNALAGAKRTLARWHPRMAVCVYHLPDDPVEVPRAVLAGWNGYRQECGKCLVAGARVLPEVFFYY